MTHNLTLRIAYEFRYVEGQELRVLFCNRCSVQHLAKARQRSVSEGGFDRGLGCYLVRFDPKYLISWHASVTTAVLMRPREQEGSLSWP